MIVNIITLFPEFFSSPISSGLMGKAIDKKIVTVNIIDLRSFSTNKHHRCDEYPFGGGAGMVMTPDPFFRAVESLHAPGMVLFPTPSGVPLKQKLVEEFSRQEELTILCGHYEGVDQRVIDSLVDIEVSTGDYVLSGGEFAALVILDSVARLIPGFMSNSESLSEESFEDNLLEYPHYTRPREYRGMDVPDVLLSGNHGEIEKWRLAKRIEKTRRVRPDLYRLFNEEEREGEE